MSLEQARVAARAALSALALSVAAVGLSGCADERPRLRHQTADEWADQLFAQDGQQVGEAIHALSEMGKTHADVVLAAVADRMARPTPKPIAAPFTVRIDAEGARRLGLAPLDPSEAFTHVQKWIDARLARLGFTKPSIRATPRLEAPSKKEAPQNDEIDIVAIEPKTRAEIERAQAVLCERGALDLRVVATDPAGPRPALSLRVVYTDPMPHAERVAAEILRFDDARKAGTRYEPASPRWRLVPRAVPGAAAAKEPKDFVLVEEPADDASTLNERIAADAKAVARNGVVSIAIQVRDDRAAAVRTFVSANTGLTLAVILDDELVAEGSMPPTDGKRLEIPFGPGASDSATATRAGDVAMALPTGRLPRPLAPVAIHERFDADPPPKNPFSEVLARLGAKALPTLDKIENGSWPRWAKASAQWARQNQSGG